MLFYIGAITCSEDKSEETIVGQTIPVRKFRMDFPGEGVVKAKHVNSNYFVILEKLSPLEKLPGDRSIILLDNEGTQLCRINPPADAFIDAEFDGKYIYSASVTHNTDPDTITLYVKKYSANGSMVSSSVVFEETNSIVGGDNIKIVSGSEYLHLAVFREDETTHLYKLRKEDLSEEWSLLVEPYANRMHIGMTGGSYDTFDQLSHMFSVYLDIDKDENAYIGIPVMGNSITRSINFHNNYFGESLQIKSQYQGESSLATDSIITKVSAQGERIFTTVMGTLHQDEIHGLRIINGSIVTFGRCVITNRNDWDPYLTVHDKETGDELFSVNFDFQENDIFLASGYDTETDKIYLGGNGGWSQNPEGLSVSDDGAKLMITADMQSGALTENFTLPNGPRMNQLRSIQVIDDSHLMIAGWENGPGTHIGDSDHSLVYSDGFLEVR